MSQPAAHWKATAKAYCGSRSAKLTILTDSVTCAKCKKGCKAAWDAMMAGQPKRKGVE